MERQAAGMVSKERADPLDQVWADPLLAEEREERGGLHVVETSLHIEKESGYFVAEAMKGLNVML